MMKEFRAFVLSPLPAAMLGGFVSWTTGGHPRPLSVAIFHLMLLYPVQLALGWPIRAFLMRTGRRSPLAFTLGGLAMTAIPTAAYLLWAGAAYPEKSAVAGEVFILWSLLGGLTGLCYWRLARVGTKARQPQEEDA